MAEDQQKLAGGEDLPEEITIDEEAGVVVTADQVVQSAFESSGFTAEEWQQLDASDREKLIRDALQEAKDAVAEKKAETKQENEQQDQQVSQAGDTNDQDTATADTDQSEQQPQQQQQTSQAGGEDSILERATDIRDELKDYVANMAPNVPQTQTSGAQYQAKLYRIIERVLNEEDPNTFSVMMSQLLEYVHHYRRTVFAENMAFRFMDAVTLNARQRQTFERVLNLLLTLHERQSRQHALQQVDLDSTLEYVSEEAKQRVQSFFGDAL